MHLSANLLESWQNKDREDLMYDTVLLTIFGICMLILLNMARLEIRDQLRAKRKRALLAFARKLKKMFKKPAPD